MSGLKTNSKNLSQDLEIIKKDIIRKITQKTKDIFIPDELITYIKKDKSKIADKIRALYFKFIERNKPKSITTKKSIYAKSYPAGGQLKK